MNKYIILLFALFVIAYTYSIMDIKKNNKCVNQICTKELIMCNNEKLCSSYEQTNQYITNQYITKNNNFDINPPNDILQTNKINTYTDFETYNPKNYYDNQYGILKKYI